MVAALIGVQLDRDFCGVPRLDNAEAVARAAGDAATIRTHLTLFANLQANADTSFNTVFLRGRLVLGDGGEGIYYRWDGSLAPDNGWTTLVDAAGQRWYRAYSQVAGSPGAGEWDRVAS